MATWVVIFAALAGSLFLIKLTYVICTALALPVTRGALYVSTSRTRIAAFLQAVPMHPGQVLVDLGCGDGRVLRKARQRYGVEGIGYELNLLAYLKARLQSIGARGIRIRRQNFWGVSLSEADVIFCYLFPDVMKRLADKVRAEVKPGAVLASANFPLPGFAPEQIVQPDQSFAPIYIYRFKVKHPQGSVNKEAGSRG